MLATVGFIVTGIFFGVFAFTFNYLVSNHTKLKLRQFSAAYYLLAVAFLLWGLAAGIGDQELLWRSVLIGNGLLLAGTVLMVELVIRPKDQLFWRLLGMALAVGLVFARYAYYPPVPYMQGDILVFNTQTPVALLLGTIFLGVWLPINLRVAKVVTHALKQDSLAPIYSYVYGIATIAALVFLAARRTVTIVLSFVSVSVCFLLLIGSNFLALKLKERHGRKA